MDLADGGGEEDKGWVGQGGSAGRRIGSGTGRRIGSGTGRGDWASCDLPGFFVAGDKKVGARAGRQSHQFSLPVKSKSKSTMDGLDLVLGLKCQEFYTYHIELEVLRISTLI